MCEVIATRTVQEMTGVISLRNSSDNKKYLQPWISKHDSYKDHELKCGYKVTYNKHGAASSVWVGDGDEPIGKALVSYSQFINYWKQNHGNIVVKMSIKDICSLYHALENQHHYNLSNDLLFCKKTDDNGKGGAKDIIADNPEEDILVSLTFSEFDWDSEDANIDDSSNKKSIPPHNIMSLQDQTRLKLESK